MNSNATPEAKARGGSATYGHGIGPDMTGAGVPAGPPSLLPLGKAVSLGEVIQSVHLEN